MSKYGLRHFIRLAVLGGSVALLVACGGDFSVGEKQQDSGEQDGEPVVVSLVQGSETEVFAGDEVVDPDGNARIRVRHESSDDRKFVTLLSGSANLVRHTEGEG